MDDKDKFTLKLLKKGSRWYVNEDNGFTLEENELISGVPVVIEYFTGIKAKEASVQISLSSFDGCSVLIKDKELPNRGGVYYTFQDVDKLGQEVSVACYFCPVFYHYFPETLPDKLFFKIYT